jgi:hypothetical protein
MLSEGYIVNGLVQRGLPEHVARGFAINMRDESGLNPGINEAAPIVPGSRGGFGLYQVTGPRRKAYEAFAGQRGVDLADPDAQLDFLMTELQGPEARAAKSILASKDTPEAAIAIARDFLRPAPEHLQKRIARYSGGTSMQPTVSTQGAMPSQPEEKQPFYKNPNFWDTLAMGFAGMSLNPNQAIIQSSANRIKGRQEQAASSKSRNRTAEWLKSQGRDDLAQAVLSGAIDGKTAAGIAYQQPKEEFRQVSGADLGLTGADAAKMFNVAPDGKITAIGGSGTTVNVGGDSQTPFQEAVDKKFADRYLDWKTSGSADTSQQVAQISSVLSKLEAGDQLTGPAVAAIDAVGLGSIFTPDAKDAKERVESVVQRSLRETLGAQFTEKEGERLIRRAYNPALPPEKNAARLRALYMTLSAADNAKRAMIAHVEENGTLAGYSGPQIPSASQMEAAMDAAAPSQASQQGGKPTHRFNPQTGQVEEISQ